MRVWRRTLGFWQEHLFEDEGSFSAVRASGGVGASERSEEVLPGRRRGILPSRRRGHVQEIAALVECRFSASIAEDAVVADSDEVRREDVEEEALDELEGGQRHCAGAVVLLRISVLEGDPGFRRD